MDERINSGRTSGTLMFSVACGHGPRAALSVESTGRKGEWMGEETQPNTIPIPPPRPGWWTRLRAYLGTAGLVLAVVLILAGIAVAGSLVPAVRHGVGKVVTRHGSPTVKSQLVTPSLRDGSPSRNPSSYTRSAASRPPSRTAAPTPAPGRTRIVPSAVWHATPKPTTRVSPSVTPTVEPTTPSATAPPSTTAPPPTTPAPTTPAPTPTSATPAVTTTGAAPVTS